MLNQRMWVTRVIVAIFVFVFSVMIYPPYFKFSSNGLILSARADENAASPSFTKSKIPYLVHDGDHELCSTILRQTQIMMARDGHACGVPFANAEDSIRRPDWKSVDPASDLDLLAKIIGANSIGYATSIAGKMGPEFQSIKKQIEKIGGMEAYLRPHVQDIAAAINAGHGSLETALVDIANTGHRQRVYRMSVMRLRNKDDMTSWEAVPCGADHPHSQPYYSIYVVQDTTTSFSIYNRVSLKDLIEYQGHTYTTYQTYVGPGVQNNRVSRTSGNSPSHAYDSLVCKVLSK